MLMFVTSCASVQHVNDYCLIVTEPVYTETDVDVISPELARWMLEHIETFEKLCGDI